MWSGGEKLREINTELVRKTVKKLFLDANVNLCPDIKNCLLVAQKQEKSRIGRDFLSMMNENIQTASDENAPVCQDTGMSVVFLEIGQNVRLTGKYLYDEVNEGIRQAYGEGYFRKSVVGCPLRRENTGDNTPGIIYTDIVPGDRIKVTVMPKGFGSENCGATKMLRPADGYEGAVDFIVDTVRKAGSKPCPPMIVGVGIGGTMDMAALLAKKALLRDINAKNPDPFYEKMEEEILHRANRLGIGPGGLGGSTTVLSVSILPCPTHIAGLPVSVNIGCHVSRHAEEVI